MILDTNLIVDFLRGDKRAINKINNHNEPIKITSITAFELVMGLKEKEREQILDLINSVIVLGFNKESAIIAGDIQRQLKETGQTIDPEDCMIAGIAISNSETLTTNNIKHFSRIKNLRIEQI